MSWILAEGWLTPGSEPLVSGVGGLWPVPSGIELRGGRLQVDAG